MSKRESYEAKTEELAKAYEEPAEEAPVQEVPAQTHRFEKVDAEASGT